MENNRKHSLHKDNSLGLLTPLSMVKIPCHLKTNIAYLKTGRFFIWMCFPFRALRLWGNCHFIPNSQATCCHSTFTVPQVYQEGRSTSHVNNINRHRVVGYSGQLLVARYLESKCQFDTRRDRTL